MQTYARDPVIKRPASFRRTFLWVLLVHALIIGIVAWFRVPTPPVSMTQTMELISLPSSAGKASTGSGHIHTPPPPSPSPSKPVQTPTPPPVSEAVSQPPPPTPAPIEPVKPVETPIQATPLTQAPSEITVAIKPVEKPKIKLAPSELTPKSSSSSPTQIKSTPEKKPKQVVLSAAELATAVRPNLAPAVKSSSSTTNKPSSSPATSNASAKSEEVNSGELANKLGQALEGAGVTRSIGGVVVGSTGGSAGEFGAFYKLIQEQMYEAWEPPKELVGFKQGAEVQIHVSADGTILDATLLSSSGNSHFDQSALTAARKVTKLRQPRPEGCPEFITVNFRLT